MKTLLPALETELAAGRSAALATVVQSTGSVPRGAGACMLMTQSGNTLGTVGGGVLEHRAETVLRALLDEAHLPDTAVHPIRQGDGMPPRCLFTDSQALSRLESYALTQNEIQSLGMVCGGHVALLYQVMPPSLLPFIQSVNARMQAGTENLWLLRRVQAGHVTEMTVLDGLVQTPPDKLCGRLAVWQGGEGDTATFVEPLHYATHAYLFGGGHVSQCVAPLLAQLDFSPIVYDDRPAFASRALFPAVADVVCAPFGELAERLHITEEDEIVIMTRGHVNDLDTLVQALRTPAYYIGLIGSRSKIAHTKAMVLAQGLTEADFARVHTPIGLPILAETPMEIAVSVAAEMIRCRAEHAQKCPA